MSIILPNTKITNKNIKQILKIYIKKKKTLPINFQTINNWDVSNVTNMKSLFKHCFEFNEPLNNWNVSNVTDMSYMFTGCHDFNQPLNWTVSKVTDMKYMFADCWLFNQPLNWNVSKVTDMSHIFESCEIFNQPLNNWNVSNVTDMTQMFFACYNFNQPLNNWNVSKVTDMNGMFAGCKRFNQPLDNWNVSNVTIMYEMFYECINFNQPLNNWDISNVNVYYRIFYNCPISQQNKPPFENAIIDVDAEQIHRESAKINYEKLNQFLKEKINENKKNSVWKNVNKDTVLINEIPIDELSINDLSINNLSNFINKMMINIINEEPNLEKETFQKRNLQKIMNERLIDFNFEDISSLIYENIYYVLHYVSIQPKLFQEMYIETFLADCINAYEGIDGMTCPLGALERITVSLVPACTTNLDNTDYQTIISIITANPNKLIPEYIKDWYQLHKTGTSDAFSSKTTEEEKRENLKSYLLTKFPNENELIDKKIIEYADEIGYDKKSFTYGGRKTRKTTKRKTTKRKTTKRKTTKRKTIKRKTNYYLTSLFDRNI